jgi:hypothetical protein
MSIPLLPDTLESAIRGHDESLLGLWNAASMQLDSTSDDKQSDAESQRSDIGVQPDGMFNHDVQHRDDTIRPIQWKE